MKYKISIGSVFKNESFNLKEWLEHYLNRGVEHFYLIDDNSDDDYMSILDPYIRDGIVTLFINDVPKFPRNAGRQNKIYNKYLLPIIQDSEWFYVCDLDEFLYSPKHLKLLDALDKYKNYTIILVNWLCFNACEGDKHPKSLVESCLKRVGYYEYVNALMPDGTYSRQFVHGRKYILNLTNPNTVVKDIGLHDCAVTPYTSVNASYTALGDEFDLAVNHYYLQSKEFWEKIKMKRGDCDNWHPDNNRNWDYFNTLNVGSEIDTRLLLQNEKYGLKYSS